MSNPPPSFISAHCLSLRLMEHLNAGGTGENSGGGGVKLEFEKWREPRGCSHMMSAKNGGVWIPPPPLVTQNQQLAYPPSTAL